MLHQTLDFTTNDYTTRIPVKIPVGGAVKEYSLILLTGAGSTTYENYRTNAIKFDKDGQPSGFENLAELAPLLVSLCLVNDTDGPVSVSEVKTFPAKVLEKLHVTTKEINGLNKSQGMNEVIKKVFSQEGYPCSVVSIRDWLKTLEQTKDVEAVLELFEETEEEKTKNS